ncbi:MAG TPA: hypothetical protein VFG63_06030 [Nocardioidaceae bacterium]|nr:hypothetical protein [Nocardioidaceae bacterium]
MTSPRATHLAASVAYAVLALAIGGIMLSSANLLPSIDLPGPRLSAAGQHADVPVSESPVTADTSEPAGDVPRPRPSVVLPSVQASICPAVGGCIAPEVLVPSIFPAAVAPAPGANLPPLAPGPVASDTSPRAEETSAPDGEVVTTGQPIPPTAPTGAASQPLPSAAASPTAGAGETPAPVLPEPTQPAAEPSQPPEDPGTTAAPTPVPTPTVTPSPEPTGTPTVPPDVTVDQPPTQPEIGLGSINTPRLTGTEPPPETGAGTGAGTGTGTGTGTGAGTDSGTGAVLTPTEPEPTP